MVPSPRSSQTTGRCLGVRLHSLLAHPQSSAGWRQRGDDLFRRTSRRSARHLGSSTHQHVLTAAASLPPAGLAKIFEEVGIFFRPSPNTRRRKIYVEGGRHALRYSTERCRSGQRIASLIVHSLTGDRGFESHPLQQRVAQTSDSVGAFQCLRATRAPIACLEILSLHGCKEGDQKPEDAAGKDIDDRVSRSGSFG